MTHFNKIPILSFFSGGGFLDMGFEMAGFKIIWTNEIDKTFIKLHEAGITSWRAALGNKTKSEIFNTKSITEIGAKDIENEAFPSGKPDIFGIIGGPPCQDFSLRGSLMGFDGHRGKLTITFLDKINELKPTFFVMENVTGLINGKSTGPYLQKLLDKIRKTYTIKSQVLNALDFGVPQFRERVFFVGIKKDFLKARVISHSPNDFAFPVNLRYKDARKKYNWPLTNKFGNKVNKPEGIPIELCVENYLVPFIEEHIIPNANEYFHLYGTTHKLESIKEGETNRPSFKRLHRFRYSPTACYGNNEIHLHPYQNRRLSVRETLRIQGVPDTYILPADLPLSKKFKMIGNGVPVPLSKAVAESLIFFLNNIELFNAS